ncbi:MAG: DUF1800 domain-containing protein [Chloroflexales bacterium]|nr:DUF1800 domain-containing protein [Chloroflexales bacterium]
MTLTQRGIIGGSTAMTVTAAAAATLLREPRRAIAGRCQSPAPASPANIALNRLSFGISTRDAAAFAALPGTPDQRYETWVAHQLAPANIDDSVCDQRLRATRLKIKYGAVNQARTLGLLDAPLETLWPLADHPEESERTRPHDEVRVATWIRAVYSRRQLFEILVDFWHNHFNVRATAEAPVTVTWPIYDRLIRTHALGNFRTFVEEVGRSVAMMYYLDNVSNRADGGTGGNESYARELFELHTLGAGNYLKFDNDRGLIPTVSYGAEVYPAGYIDDDVYEAARCLTGWTIADGQPDTGAFYYRADWHDTYPKTVLARRPLEGVAPGPNIPARQGDQKDGKDVFDLVCNHPGTARHLCTKLARRLVDANPPKRLVDAAVAVWMAARGAPDQILQVVRTILLSPECRSTYGAKVRRPLEAVWAYLRATEADLPSDVEAEGGDTNKGGYWSSILYQADQTGQRLFGWDTPNGHPDLASYWANTNGMLRRWNTFFNLSQSWGGNVRIDIAGQTNLGATCAQIVDFWISRLCGFPPTGTVRQDLITFLAAGGSPDAPPVPQRGAPDWGDPRAVSERVTAVVHLLAMSPDFHLR